MSTLLRLHENRTCIAVGPITAIPINDRSELRSRPKIMNNGTDQANDKGASWPMSVWVHVHARASCPYPRKYCYTYTTEKDRGAFVHLWAHCSLTKVALHSQPSKSRMLIVTGASYLKSWQKKHLPFVFFFLSKIYLPRVCLSLLQLQKIYEFDVATHI
jgi:hypothetical protein